METNSNDVAAKINTSIRIQSVTEVNMDNKNLKNPDFFVSKSKMQIT
jgi:hypothetical protein